MKALPANSFPAKILSDSISGWVASHVIAETMKLLASSRTRNMTDKGSLYIGRIELHVAGAHENIEPAVRHTLATISPNLTAWSMVSLKDQVALQFNQQRLIARLTGLFSLLALTLAAVGLYGLTAYSVAGRTEEIGIRMALGANRHSVVMMILKEG